MQVTFLFIPFLTKKPCCWVDYTQTFTWDSKRILFILMQQHPVRNCPAVPSPQIPNVSLVLIQTLHWKGHSWHGGAAAPQNSLKFIVFLQFQRKIDCWKTWGLVEITASVPVLKSLQSQTDSDLLTQRMGWNTVSLTLKQHFIFLM